VDALSVIHMTCVTLIVMWISLFITPQVLHNQENGQQAHVQV